MKEPRPTLHHLVCFISVVLHLHEAVGAASPARVGAICSDSIKCAAGLQCECTSMASSPQMYAANVSSSSCRSYRTPLAQLLGASGKVAATAWNIGRVIQPPHILVLSRCFHLCHHQCMTASTYWLQFTKILDRYEQACCERKTRVYLSELSQETNK